MSKLPDLVALAVLLTRNVYSAGNGTVTSPAVAAALFGELWRLAEKEGIQWGQNAYDLGGDSMDVDESFRRGFADGLGWSQEEFDAFWHDPNYQHTPEDAAHFDENWDAFYAMVENLKR